MSGIEVEIEPRSCAFCGKGFRVLSSSSQRFCQLYCASLFERKGDPCHQPKNVRGSALTKESVTVNASKKTQSTAFESNDSGKGWRRRKRQNQQKPKNDELALEPDTESDGPPNQSFDNARSTKPSGTITSADKPTPKLAEQSDESSTHEISKLNESAKSDEGKPMHIERSEESAGSERERKKTNAIAPITPITEIISAPSSTRPSEGVSQLTDSSKPFPNLSEDVSTSMNLLADTGKHLYGLMRKLNTKSDSSSNAIDEFVHALDADRVKAAAECGKQIISTMRLQLDMLKFAKEIKDESK